MKLAHDELISKVDVEGQLDNLQQQYVSEIQSLHEHLHQLRRESHSQSEKLEKDKEFYLTRIQGLEKEL